MGTGVGEAALAAEAFGAAEAAGAVAGAGGVADAALLGGEFAGGLGLTGGLTEGLGSVAGLGGEYAGGLGSLSPAFQTAVGQTASVMPDVAAQTVEAANAGAAPTANATLGSRSIGDPSLLQNVNATMDLDIRPDQIVDSAEPVTRTAGNADKAALLSDAGYGPMASPAEMGATKTSFGMLNPLTSAYNLWKEQDPLTKGVTGGLGALQVAKYLNKPQGVAPVAPYSGPLSKFSYSPDTYKPYVYKPYAEGGGVEAKEAAPAPVANAGLPALSAAAQALPEVAASQQNFADFLSRYQNMPVAPTAASVGAPNLNTASVQPGPSAAYYPAGSPYANMSDAQLVVAASKAKSPHELELIQGNNPAPVSAWQDWPNYQRGYDIQLAAGGTVEQMSRENALGANTGYPQADIRQGAYATPWQTPVSRNVVTGPSDANVDQMTGEERMADGGLADLSDAAKALPAILASHQNFADFLSQYQNMPIVGELAAKAQYQGLPATSSGGGNLNVDQNAGMAYGQPYDFRLGPPGNPRDPMSEGGYSGALNTPTLASGGIASLGSYSDGGRLLRGPGDGMSDNIPANISGKQPARLADGEFVVPADVVSGLGNGSTEAGAKQLYKMLDKVRAARTGTKKQGKQINPNKYTPA